MKMEFVEFYPNPMPMEKRTKNQKKIVGTVHIYLIDEELDIRGIVVSTYKNGFIFFFPHFNTIDEDTGQKVRYPLIRFTNEKKHEEMLNFLHTEVKPIIKERLLVKSE